MIGDEARGYVYLRSKIIFHIVLFVCFFGAVQIHPWFVTQVATMLAEYAFLHQILPWVLTYIAAMYILPAIAFMIVKAILDK